MRKVYFKVVMVDVNVIGQVISNILQGSYGLKCKPLSQVRSEVGSLSQEEKNKSLEGLLNRAELEYYNHLVHEKKNLEDLIEEFENGYKDYPKSLIDMNLKLFKGYLKTTNDLLFKFERRIIEGVKEKETKNAPTVDMNKYRQEKDSDDEDDGVGDIEWETINLQRESGFSSEERESLFSYFSDGYALLNSRLNNSKTWNGLSKVERDAMNPSLNKQEKDLSSAIGKTPGLSAPTRLYHRGVFDVGLVEGDHVKFKGYVSATFQKHVADEWSNDFENKIPMYTYELLCDTGQKGFCANDDSYSIMTYHGEEHEMLLDKGLEGDIVSVDVENHVVTVLVDS